MYPLCPVCRVILPDLDAPPSVCQGCSECGYTDTEDDDALAREDAAIEREQDALDDRDHARFEGMAQ